MVVIVYISHTRPGNGHWSWFHLTQQKEQCLERSGNSEEQFPGRDQTTLTFIQYHPQYSGSISFVYTLHTLERQLSRSFLVQMESRSPSKHSLMTDKAACESTLQKPWSNYLSLSSTKWPPLCYKVSIWAKPSLKIFDFRGFRVFIL